MKNLLSLLTSVFVLALFFASCSSDCDTICPTGQELDDDCNCITIMTEPCEGIECPEGQIQLSDCSCIDDPSLSDNVMVTSNITENTTWSSDKTYLLEGRITVTNGATLTIEPGTLIKGGAGAEANAKALIVARGSKINACGTAAAPIVMTSVADNISSSMIASGDFASPNLDASIKGLWGGLIVLGNAPISVEGDGGEAQIEGIPTTDTNGLYGGTVEDDNSGSLCYISIRHGGTNIGEGNEINGLTLGGVGNGTTIDNIEIVANNDDGIEWFGGTVNCTNLLVWACGDDGMDTDQDYTGTVTNWVVAVPSGGSAMELDGPEGDVSTGECNNFVDGTIYCGDDIDHVIDWDDSTNTGVTGLYVYGVDADYDIAKGFESFGGNGACASGSWEYTGPAAMFEAAGSEATEVGMNANNVGATTEGFGWTMGAATGTLSSIGL